MEYLLSIQNRRHIEGRTLRTLKRFQDVGFFTSTRAMTFKRATTVKEYRDAFKLVHDSYVEKGYIRPNASGLRVRPWETSPDAGCFICKQGEAVIGVLSVLLDSLELRLPSDRVFHRELTELRSAGCRLVEYSNQAIAPSFRNTSVAAGLMQICFGYSLHAGGTDGVGAVSSKHLSFFRVMGFEPIGEVKNYSETGYDPVILLLLADQRSRYLPGSSGHPTVNEFWYRYYIRENPFWPMYIKWQLQVDRLFSDSVALMEIFGDSLQHLTGSSKRERSAVAKNFGMVLDGSTLALGNRWISRTPDRTNAGRRPRPLTTRHPLMA